MLLNSADTRLPDKAVNGVQEAASSNLATPTKKVLDFTRKIKDFCFCFICAF